MSSHATDLSVYAKFSWLLGWLDGERERAGEGEKKRLEGWTDDNDDDVVKQIVIKNNRSAVI